MGASRECLEVLLRCRGYSAPLRRQRLSPSRRLSVGQQQQGCWARGSSWLSAPGAAVQVQGGGSSRWVLPSCSGKVGARGWVGRRGTNLRARAMASFSGVDGDDLSAAAAHQHDPIQVLSQHLQELHVWGKQLRSSREAHLLPELPTVRNPLQAHLELQVLVTHDFSWAEQGDLGKQSTPS